MEDIGSCKRDNITLTYRRHHLRSKIDTRNRNGKIDTRNRNEEEEKNYIENHEKGDANCVLLSPFAPTSLFGIKRLWDVPAPETKHRKHFPMLPPTTKDSRHLGTFLVYQKRRRVKNQVEEEYDWHEGERESFDRQIDLFLTRMRNTQGERKFSEWKGSVMDSIVGAYLAQNVDDTLSSSAFMSLAAKFSREVVGVAVGVSSPVKACSFKTRNSSIMQKGRHGCSKTPNATRQRTKIKHDPLLLTVLKDCYSKYHSKKKTFETSETIDWDSVRMAKVNDISKAIQLRGMNNNLSIRIKGFLEHLVKNFGSTDMEWIRDVPPHKAKEYLLSIYGLGLKSVECIRLLTLRQKAFPIDRNAGRVAIRLGWVTLKQGHEGKKKPNSIQRCLWPRLSHLEWSIQYELHCQAITFGKVFCTERDPNCYECPMKTECKHFASLEARAEEDSTGLMVMDLEDYGLERYRTRFRTSKRASIPVVKKRKKVTSLRTEHQVYVLPDSHDLLSELESRERDESCPYLLAVWTPESLEKDESIPEEDAVYGTLLIPARTATGGTFPLNGTFFQSNEVFADDKSSKVPIRVPRASLTNLLSTTLYCGKNMSSICKGMSCVEVQKCFKSGFVCFRGLDLKTRETKLLAERFHNRARQRKPRSVRDNGK